MITEAATKEFKEIWAQKYSKELTDDEALAKATALLTLFKSIYLPIQEASNVH